MKVLVFLCLAGLCLMMVDFAFSLPLELCSEVCPLNLTLICATNDVCLRAFSNSCDLDFHNCLNDEKFRNVDAEYCKSSSYVLCNEDDQNIISSFS
ncbi:uncharacterized protein LOC129947221 [Eupeodes corollae]|uniref:uncharacterized protein LOC129947221 n=1 Tax=Eupeodes corollae TaxID=290404 RepID=UPI0024907917|nr:uncharacterized protein LOC129947221 [Eupeodes corollae]